MARDHNDHQGDNIYVKLCSSLTTDRRREELLILSLNSTAYMGCVHKEEEIGFTF